VKLSEELFEFMEPHVLLIHTKDNQIILQYLETIPVHIIVKFFTLQNLVIPIIREEMKRNNLEKVLDHSKIWAIQSDWKKKTWLPLAVTVKSTENYNGMQVAERQILLIAKDEVSFDDMKRVIEWKGWKLLANNFNMYQVDVSSQGESLDEILKIAETMPEVEVASVNSISSPN
jgi:hypothetical protein